MNARVLMIDNYDSFTYNLVQALRMLGAAVDVTRNDEITPEHASRAGYTHLVISPGPGAPDAAGVSKDMIRALAGTMPILGVCLGHQAIAEVFGARVARAGCVMHGKPSLIRHDGRGVYAGLANPLAGGRYHSLAAIRDTLPTCLDVTARTDDGEIMGLRHRELTVEGVQFHPESVLTPEGPRLIENFLRYAGGKWPAAGASAGAPGRTHEGAGA